jgi:hypothetical protein
MLIYVKIASPDRRSVSIADLRPVAGLQETREDPG